MSRSLRVLGLCGSLRKASLNAAALRAARDLAPPGMTIEIGDISAVPIFNDDDLKARGLPEPVERLCDAVRAADAVLISSPEYNYSIPGVLKNAIDWISRAAPPPFADKPVAIMGASPGMLGTSRMQYDLRKVFVFLDGRVLNKPEVMIGGAASKFDAEGRLVDQTTRDIIGKQLEALRDWTLRLHPGEPGTPLK